MALFREGHFGLPTVAVTLIALACLSLPAFADTRLDEAQACTLKSQRLERLACFDRVFATPVTVNARMTAQVRRPARWQQAYAQEQKRLPADGVLYQHTGTQVGHLITLPALGTRPPRPLLTIQCHNNITELSLMLPQPIAEERAALRFTSIIHNSEQLWRARDEGFVLSGGRGLPAIETIKALLSQSQLEVTSDSAVVDGLVFDLSGLIAQLAPLRSACGW